MLLAGRKPFFIRTRLRQVLVALLTLLIIGGVWAGAYAYHIYVGLNNITARPVPYTRYEPTVVIPPINGTKRINILILGSDNDTKVEEKRPLTQSMIVVTIDPMHDKVGLLSIPRDFWVPIRGHGYDKIDVAHKYGGVALARETVEKLFHIQIHHYAWVGLNGFQNIIDTFNGVNMDVLHPVLDDFYPNDVTSADPYGYKRVFIPEGWRHMSGRQALEYVRSRHGDAIGDFGRSTRQQQLLTQLRAKLTTFNILTHISSLIDDLQGNLRTDLDWEQIYQLQQLSKKIPAKNVWKVVLTAPQYSQYGFVYQNGAQQSILRPKWTAIRPIIKTMFAPINASVPHASPPAPRPRVTVTAIPPTPRAVSTPTPNPGPTATVTPIPPPLRLPARLLFIHNGNVAIMDRDGHITDLTCTAGLSMPAIAPNGKSLAFVRWHPYSSNIEVLDLKPNSGCPVGGRQITQDESSNIHNNLWAVWPIWSSDSSHILYSTDRAKLPAVASESRPLELGIWSIPESGGLPTQLTTPQQGAGGDAEPTARPHSTQFVYVQWQYNTQTNQPYSQLVLRDTASGATSTLTPPNQRAFQPQFDRSGNRIVFIRVENGADQVVTAPLIGAGTTVHLGPITALAGGQVTQPAFTPGGKWVSFMQAEGGGFALYLIPSRGGTAYRVDQTGSDLDATSRPAWIK